MRKILASPSDLPRGVDLPDSDGLPMDDDRHGDQARLYLIKPLRYWLKASGIAAFVGGNSFVYYDYDPIKRKALFLGPDIYVVMGGEQSGQSKWVVWEEGGRMPTLAIELLSPTTARRDRGDKLGIYRDRLRCQDYFLFDNIRGRLEGFHLVGGAYLKVDFITQGAPIEGSSWLPCSGIDLWLGVVDGWLRWFDPHTRKLLPTDEERADRERERAERERQRADEAIAELRRLRGETPD